MTSRAVLGVTRLGRRSGSKWETLLKAIDVQRVALSVGLEVIYPMYGASKRELL